MSNISYHNTNNEQGSTLATSEAKAKSQEDVVFEFYKCRQDIPYTAEQAYKVIMGLKEIHENTPLTSIRRAITNLCNEGKLTKLNTFKKSSYGKMTHCYIYTTKPTLF